MVGPRDVPARSGNERSSTLKLSRRLLSVSDLLRFGKSRAITTAKSSGFRCDDEQVVGLLRGGIWARHAAYINN
jgi:hypothetical protein